mgnify:FL=1
MDELKPDFIETGKKSRDPECTSLAWSADGQTLFAGCVSLAFVVVLVVQELTFRFLRSYTDDLVRVFSVTS